MRVMGEKFPVKKGLEQLDYLMQLNVWKILVIANLIDLLKILEWGEL